MRTVRPGVYEISPVSICEDVYGVKDLRERCVLSLDWKIDWSWEWWWWQCGSDLCRVVRRWKTRMWMWLTERVRGLIPNTLRLMLFNQCKVQLLVPWTAALRSQISSWSCHHLSSQTLTVLTVSHRTTQYRWFKLTEKWTWLGLRRDSSVSLRLWHIRTKRYCSFINYYQWQLFILLLHHFIIFYVYDMNEWMNDKNLYSALKSLQMYA